MEQWPWELEKTAPLGTRGKPHGRGPQDLAETYMEGRVLKGTRGGNGKCKDPGVRGDGLHKRLRSPPLRRVQCTREVRKVFREAEPRVGKF